MKEPGKLAIAPLKNSLEISALKNKEYISNLMKESDKISEESKIYNPKPSDKRKRLSPSKDTSLKDIPGQEPIKKQKSTEYSKYNNFCIKMPYDQNTDQVMTAKNLYLTKEFKDLKFRHDITCTEKVECIISLGDLKFAIATQTKLNYYTIGNLKQDIITFDSTLWTNPITCMTSSKVMIRQSEDIEIVNHYLACGYQNSHIKIFSIPGGDEIKDFEYHVNFRETKSNISISSLLIVNNKLLIATGHVG